MANKSDCLVFYVIAWACFSACNQECLHVFVPIPLITARTSINLCRNAKRRLTFTNYKALLEHLSEIKGALAADRTGFLEFLKELKSKHFLFYETALFSKIKSIRSC